MKFRTILTLITTVVACSVQAQPKVRPEPPSADEALVDMAQAFRRNNTARIAQLLPLVQGHPLQVWADYWALKSRLDEARPEEVQAFLTRYAGSYQEDRLRNDWLLLLGQRRDWDAFSDELPRFRMNDDPQVRCYALLVRQLREGATPELAEEVRRLWFAQRDAEDACTTAARDLYSDKRGPARITPLDVWQKARLATDTNRSQAAADALAIAAPEHLPELRKLQASPAKFLARHVVAGTRKHKELVVLALLRLSSGDLEGAASSLDRKWEPMLSEEERDWLWGAFGARAAQRLSPDALGYFAKVRRASHLTDDMLAWKARAALRAGSTPDWKALRQAIDAMSPPAQRDPTWLYWRARALLATGKEDGERAGRELLQAIASPRGFYEQLAMEELGRKIAPPAAPPPPTPEELATARANAGLQRAMQAIDLGLRSEGVREWNYMVALHTPGGMGERELLAAAQIACNREIWDRCINTSERTREAFDVAQRFPMPFREVVVRRSRDIALDPAYVYGLIRQESRFVMDARSHVGASGLMQVMPATARWTVRKLGLNFTPAQLHDHEANIAIGTGYLKLVLDDFDGSMPLAAAAYNAGPRRSRQWREGPTMDAAAWAETVPFHETREYVKKVLANTTMYAAILSGQPQSLKARLGQVGPRAAGQPELDGDMP